METDQQANILLVDDRPENLLVLESVLGDLGCNLVKAQSGSEALRWLLNQDFAAVLLDVNMPGMDGFETATLIRQRSRSEHTPIIFVTAFGASDMDRLRGYELGAVDYMSTPIVPEILRAKVRVFVDLFRMAAQLKRQADELAAVNAALRQARDELDMRVRERTAELAQANQKLQTEIAERQRAEEEMRTLSFVDDLTGLHNRRGFLAFAGQALKLAKRLTRRPSLLFADLDGLKGINDSLGHHGGDLALAETATTLRETFRDSDIVARIGGDEFAVLAMESEEAGTEIITARLRQNLERHNARKNRRYRLSLSMGVTRYDPKMHHSIGELLAEADTLMYGEKRPRGESRPVGWDPSGRAAPADRATTGTQGN